MSAEYKTLAAVLKVLRDRRVISSKGHVMPPHFFETGQRVNTKEYIKVLDTVVKPLMELLPQRVSPCVSQQDKTPAHTANITQNWLKANLKDHWPKEIWPPSSPDCNSLDYFMWGTVDREVKKQPHFTLASVRTKISEVMTDKNREVVIRACKKFCLWIKAVVEKGGDFIK